MKLLALAILLLSFSLTLSANQSPYHGQQNREIKSLSEQDIKALVSGSGWGLAKPAELNGVPGPLHLLELRDEIGLTEHQVKEIEGVWFSMNQSAKNHGEKYLISERKIDHFFKANREDLKNLDKLLKESSYHLTNLRLTHLLSTKKGVDL